MTREEAVSYLEFEREQVLNKSDGITSKLTEAYDMAIEALQEKEKVIAQLEELRDGPIMHYSEYYWEGHYQAAKEAIEIVKGGAE